MTKEARISVIWKALHFAKISLPTMYYQALSNFPVRAVLGRQQEGKGVIKALANCLTLVAEHI